ncbi:hemolysin-type calcium-binding repeat 2 copies family protein [Asticcacaulis biprosthecium C19]|uniref:Hemolysin-type calcium-binding repeat 2 copies family protein n=1 Tax=Asticcacaulis biprosthecium C19 TaxID=715226 RepID=F4QII4_9CAUL|nr:calcium-binding protein [Asticcacaulis biprosthecium]EGF92973.1 hemolysin-type calcium-binding repeat 2 copies family protein [Asticcacaulis biprosthecium C19]
MPALFVDHSGRTGGVANAIYLDGSPASRAHDGKIHSSLLPSFDDSPFRVIITAPALTHESLGTPPVAAIGDDSQKLVTGNGGLRNSPGDDIFTYNNPTGYIYVEGGAGKDTLNVNAASQVVGVSSTLYNNGGVDFYGDLYHDTNRVQYNGIEKINYTMGLGNDTLTMDGGPLAASNTNVAVNAGGGVNTLNANLGVVATNIVMTNASLTTSRLSLKNFTTYNVTFGSGNDSVTLNNTGGQSLVLGNGNDSVTFNGALGYQYVAMGAGQDSLTVNNSAQTVAVGSTLYNNGGVDFYGDLYNDAGNRTQYNAVENLTYYMGSGSDTLTLDAGPLAVVANTVYVDAGAGGNHLSANLGVITTDIVLNNASLTTSRLSLLGFISYVVTFGSGNDSVTLTETAGQDLRLGAGNDSVTLNGAHGYQYIELAGGFDTLSVDNSTQTAGVSSNVYNDSGARFYGDFYNDGGNRTQFNGTEALVYRMGTGNDALTFDGGVLATVANSADIDAGGGTDTLTSANLSVITTDITVFNSSLTADRVALNGFEIYGTVYMGSGNDSVTVAGANNQSWRMAGGNDTVTLTSAAGYQYVEAGDGTDSLSIDNHTVTANVGHAIYNDSGIRFYGDIYNDTNRTQFNGTENLSVIAGSGNDALSLDGGPLVNSNTSIAFDAGAGSDSLSANLGALTANIVLNETSLTSTRLSLLNFEVFNVTFGSGNDTVTRTTATSEQFRLAGGDDAITLNSAIGYQYVEGGSGYDFLTVRNNSQDTGVTSYIYNDSGVRFYGDFYNEGANRTQFNGMERIAYTMGRGDDVMNVDGNALGAAGNRLNLSGGTGIDHLNLNLSGLSGLNLVWSGVTLTIGVNTFASFESINVALASGSQYILRGGGNDSYAGSNSNDTIDGGAGNDTLNGQAGFDIASYASATGPVTVSLALQGAAQATGNGNDLLTNFEGLLGSTFNDSLTGDNNANRLDGNTGNDTLVGGLGNDTYVINSAGDAFGEAAGGGLDTVESSITLTLSAELENLTLTSTAVINGTGNGLNNILTGNSATNVLSGGLGDDTYVVQNSSDNVVESAGQGTDIIFASASYSLAGRIVEVLTLTGAADIDATGNGNANTLNGNSGHNRLDGGTGNDSLTGGLGNDTYVVNTTGDLVTEAAGEGTDTVETSITLTLGANLENLSLIGATAINGIGNALDNVLTGNSGNNVLSGLAGNDTYYVQSQTDSVVESAGGGVDVVYSSATRDFLGTQVENLILTGSANINGSGNELANRIEGNSGNNVLTGLAGDDTYVVQNTGDSTVEAAAEGTDTVESAITWTLGSNVENLLLTGAAAVNGTGNTGNNVLSGNEANNVLSGLAGNDTYYIQNSGDNVVEANGDGSDTVISTVSYSLAGRYVEFLTLAGAANLDATGNGNANTLTGNNGVNTLSGLGGHDSLDGGAGADTMIGGTGNDSYVVDDAEDVVTEAAGEGIDLVSTALTHTLAANVDNLTLTGSDAVNGTGNALNNVLTGNSGVNVLTGGLGNDTYYVQTSGDNVVEASGEGTDVISSTVSYSLSGRYAETINLTGSANVNATGNSLANTLTGNSGNNTLNGKGGADVLAGGLGADLFLFEAASGADTISDFSAAQNDTININAYTSGVVSSGMVTQSGANVLITLGGGNVITVNSATTADVLAHIVW